MQAQGSRQGRAPALDEKHKKDKPKASSNRNRRMTMKDEIELKVVSFSFPLFWLLSPSSPVSSAVRDDYMVRTIYSAVHTLRARREIIDMTDRSSEDQKNKPNDPANGQLDNQINGHDRNGWELLIAVSA